MTSRTRRQANALVSVMTEPIFRPFSRPADDIDQAFPEIEVPQLSAFDVVPEHGYGVVIMRGQVIVYDSEALHREAVIEGEYYVAESQRPPGNMPLINWLRLEQRDEVRAQPYSPLKTERQVVQLVRRGIGPDNWFQRLVGGYGDGPYYDATIGNNLVGRVVGIFRPHGPRQVTR